MDAAVNVGLFQLSSDHASCMDEICDIVTKACNDANPDTGLCIFSCVHSCSVLPDVTPKTAEAKLTQIMRREADKELADSKKTGQGAERLPPGVQSRDIEQFLNTCAFLLRLICSMK